MYVWIRIVAFRMWPYVASFEACAEGRRGISRGAARGLQRGGAGSAEGRRGIYRGAARDLQMGGLEPRTLRPALLRIPRNPRGIRTGNPGLDLGECLPNNGNPRVPLGEHPPFHGRRPAGTEGDRMETGWAGVPPPLFPRG